MRATLKQITKSPTTIFFILFVATFAWFAGSVSGTYQPRETQVAATAGLEGCDAPGVTCNFNPTTPPAPATPGAGCKAPIPKQNIQPCQLQKAIAEKQVTSGVNKPAPTFTKLEYTPSTCTAETSVGGGKCNPNATKTCPTAHANDKTECFWTSCPKSVCSADGGDDDKTESQLPPPSEQQASSTPQESGGEQPQMPQGGGGGGGEEKPQEQPKEQKCLIDPEAPGCQDEEEKERLAGLEERVQSSIDAINEIANSTTTTVSDSANVVDRGIRTISDDPEFHEAPAGSEEEVVLAEAPKEPSTVDKVKNVFYSIGGQGVVDHAVANNLGDVVQDSVTTATTGIADTINDLARRTYNLVSSFRNFFSL